MITRDAARANDILILPDVEDPRDVDLTNSIDGADGRIVDGTAGLTLGTSTLRRYRLLGFLLVPVDVLCLAVALLIAFALRFARLPELDYLMGIALAGLLWSGVFHALGLYAPQHMSGLEEFRRTILAVVVGIVVVILATFWLDYYLSRSWMAITLVIALVLELTARMVIRRRIAGLRASDSLMLRTLVIGDSEQVTEPIEVLGRPGSGFLPLGWVDAKSPLLASAEISPTDRVRRLRLVIQQYRPDCIFMASTTIGPRQMLAVMQAARQEGVVVRIYTHLSVWASRLTAQPLGNEGVALTVKPAGLSTSQRFIKRGMDVTLATLGLVAVSPILFLAAIAIRITSGSPVLFRQQRVTEGARTFVMYKFRTMTNGAEHAAAANGVDTSVPFFKVRADPRLTRVGKVLRRWSIDELPQLLNVLLGDMSLVGPRPLPAEQVSANIELLGPRHEMRSGITGWWQVQGRSDVVDHEEAIRMDHFYIENWSPALDVYVLLRTVGALSTRKGAF